MPVELSSKSAYRQYNRYIFYCLPAKIEKYKDDLYDQDIERLGYSDPFKFQAAIVHSGDTKFALWTTVKNVTNMSIIFHGEHHRWWKVASIVNDLTGDGSILNCVPSNLQPDFGTM